MILSFQSLSGMHDPVVLVTVWSDPVVLVTVRSDLDVLVSQE